MKAKLLVFLLFFSLVLSNANAVLIEVKVPKTLKGNVTSFSYDFSKNLVAFKLEFYNSGSISYTGRARIDVFNDSQTIFTAWSEEKKFMPGDRKIFELYWFTNLTGNFSGRIRMYFANEMLEKTFDLEKIYSYPTENVFTISSFRTYENAVVFDLKAEKDVKNVVIIPENIPLGWIFQQKKIEEMKKGEVRTVAISYKPTVWSEENLALSIADGDGKYFAQEEVKLKKESGLLGFVHYLIDLLKLAKEGYF
jgi:hypothetical protein